MAEDIQVLSGVIGPGSAFIFSELHIEYPVELILNPPMAAFGLQYLVSCHPFAAIDKIVSLFGFLSLFLNFTENNADSL